MWLDSSLLYRTKAPVCKTFPDTALERVMQRPAKFSFKLLRDLEWIPECDDGHHAVTPSQTELSVTIWQHSACLNWMAFVVQFCSDTGLVAVQVHSAAPDSAETSEYAYGLRVMTYREQADE